METDDIVEIFSTDEKETKVRYRPPGGTTYVFTWIDLDVVPAPDADVDA